MKYKNFEEFLNKIMLVLTNDYKGISNETITFSTAGVYKLTVPDNAKYALCLLEETGATGTSKVIRYWLDGSSPTSSVGISRGDMDAFDIIGYQNLKNFSAIRVTASSHKMFVQYFG